MVYNMKSLLLAIVVLFQYSSTCAQHPQVHTESIDSSYQSPAASIDQLAWIAGYWKGEAFGGLTEEIWSEPNAGSMMGSFKLSEGEQIIFYELCILRELDNTVLLQLKHFGDDLKGWEEKNETQDFRLVRIEKDKALFDGFSFEKISDEEMHLYVLIGGEDGTVSEEKFVYKRYK